jgi:hypothetical protein
LRCLFFHDAAAFDVRRDHLTGSSQTLRAPHDSTY